MKFADIQQFTRDGEWQCDYDIVRAVEQINDWIKKEGLELNPDFQRGHVWTEEQQIAYVEFLLRGGKTARVLYFNHPGWMGSFKGHMVCVDGLQRITALQRFVNNEIKVFGYYFNKYEDSPSAIRHGIRFNVNNLKTRKEILQWYLDFNSGGTVHKKEELDKVKRLIEQEIS